MLRGRTDILFKLRLFFWVLVLALWGMFMHQFMRKDISSIPKFHLLKNPFQTRPAPARVVVERVRPAPLPPIAAKQPHVKLGGAAPSGEGPASGWKQPAKASPAFGKLLRPIPTGDIIGVAYKSSIINAEHSSQERQSLSRQTTEPSEKWPAPPPGFTVARTKHFKIYQEGPKTAQELLSTIEVLHGNLMLDLVAFSPWTRDEKVLVYFFKTQPAYRKTTGRSSWSGGASSLSKRIIYIYENKEAFAILAHELCHIYFDSFFNTSTPNPLWLSEGMATLIQTERGMSPPNWLKSNLGLLKQGGGFRLADLMRIDNTRHASEASVRLWYAQSYSVVRFLMHMKPGNSFYQFCKMLRDDHRVNVALFRAYGMPFNRVTALEYAWRYDIQTRGSLPDRNLVKK